jgi:hypothetical protein
MDDKRNSTMKNIDSTSDQNRFGNNLQTKVADTSIKNNLPDVAAVEHVKSPFETVQSGSEETARNSLRERSHSPSRKNREKQRGLGFQEKGSKGNQGISDRNSFGTRKVVSLSEAKRQAPERIAERKSPEEKITREGGKTVLEMIGDRDPYEFYKEKILELLGKFFLQDESFELFIRRKTFSEMDDHVPPCLAKVSELMISESGKLGLLLEWNGGYDVIEDRLKASRVKFQEQY